MKQPVPQVGSQDPEHRTSSINDENEEISLNLELQSGACYFNGVA